MKPHLKGTSTFFVLLVFSMSVVVPLSKPVLSPVIIKLDDGKAIETVVSGIRGEFSYSIVVDYDSINYYLFAWRAYSDLIIVGHGSPN